LPLAVNLYDRQAHELIVPLLGQSLCA
jgi:hypothetical protein